MYHNHLELLSEEMIRRFAQELGDCDGIIYSVGDLGICFEKHWPEGTGRHKAAMIDRFPGADELRIACLGQSFSSMTEKILECLTEQNMENSTWQPDVYFIEGGLSDDGL